jgi:hypothetical protein
MVPDESDSDGAADGSSSWQDGDGQLPDPFTGDAPDSPARSPVGGRGPGSVSCSWSFSS